MLINYKGGLCVTKKAVYQLTNVVW